MKRNTQLLIIDPQNDFCDLPPDWCSASREASLSSGVGLPSLPVAGAHQDMLRLAGWMRQSASLLDSITLTMDAHHRIDIAHPGFWMTGQGQTVDPFTMITAAQVREGVFLPRQPDKLARALHYLEELEFRGRYTLMVWPVHCEIGTWGQNIHNAIQGACAAWEEAGHGSVLYVQKGRNPWTEHYSAVQAEVPDENDPDSLSNLTLLSHLSAADTLFIAGEASSHCVRATTEHLVEQLPDDFRRRMVLIADCMSPVTGFEKQATGFLEDMRAQGLRIMTANEAAGCLAAAT